MFQTRCRFGSTLVVVLFLLIVVFKALHAHPTRSRSGLGLSINEAAGWLTISQEKACRAHVGHRSKLVAGRATSVCLASGQLLDVAYTEELLIAT